MLDSYNYDDDQLKTKETEGRVTASTPPGLNASENIEQRELTQPQKIYNLLGQETVLLSAYGGEKYPNLKAWDKITLQDTLTKEYQTKLFLARNLGVLLGKASNNLCAIDIDSDDQVEPFLEANPLLRGSLRTKGSRGCQIWVRINGDYPKLTPLKTTTDEKWGEWRSDGGQSIICGLHPNGNEYTREVDAPPVEISFGEINWPTNVQNPWVKSDFEILVEQEGAPYFLDENGHIKGKLNDGFFVARFMMERIVLFDQGPGVFFEYNPTDGLWHSKSADEIMGQMESDFTRSAKETSQKDQLLHMRSAKLFKNWLDLMKTRCVKRDPFGKRPSAIHLKNGMLILGDESVRLVSFSPDFYSRNMVPFEYDPTAECPRFVNNFLSSALEDEDIDLLQRWCGSLLLGENKAQRIMLLTGMSASGKSTAMSVIEGVIGLINVATLRTNQLNQRFELAAFSNKTLLVAKDVPESFMSKNGVSMLKSLVGHDMQEVEWKSGNERTQIKGDFNVSITCNANLHIKLEGDEEAWRRRLLVINYTKCPQTRRIAGLDQILLREEGNGILRWMIEGAIAHRKELAEIGNYRLTSEQQFRIDAMLDDSNSMNEYVKQNMSPFKGSTVTSYELSQGFLNSSWNAAGYSPGKTLQMLPNVVGTVFGAKVAHDIIRDGKQVRGYNGFRMAEPALN